MSMIQIVFLILLVAKVFTNSNLSWLAVMSPIIVFFCIELISIIIED